MLSVVVAAACAATVVAAAPAVQSAPRKPGLYGPTSAVVGQEVAFSSVFLAKDRKNICFAPDIDWGDAPSSRGFGMCLKLGSSGRYTREVDTYRHVFTSPGTYVVTVTAAGMSAVGEPYTKPSLATVKGPRRYTRTIAVSPAPDAAPDPTASTAADAPAAGGSS